MTVGGFRGRLPKIYGAWNAIATMLGSTIVLTETGRDAQIFPEAQFRRQYSGQCKLGYQFLAESLLASFLYGSCSS
jgi:hypothetical protein